MDEETGADNGRDVTLARRGRGPGGEGEGPSGRGCDMRVGVKRHMRDNLLQLGSKVVR